MSNHGTPLEDFDSVELMGVIAIALARSGVVSDREALKHWKGRTGELSSLLRETMLKPGRRVLEVDRSKCFCYEGMVVSTQDSVAGTVLEVDLSQIRYVWYKNFDPHRHTLLDSYVLATLIRRLEVLPPNLRKVQRDHTPVHFLGTEFKKLDEDRENVWAPGWYPNHSRPHMDIVRTEGEKGSNHRTQDMLIAVLVKD